MQMANWRIVENVEVKLYDSRNCFKQNKVSYLSYICTYRAIKLGLNYLHQTLTSLLPSQEPERLKWPINQWFHLFCRFHAHKLKRGDSMQTSWLNISMTMLLFTMVHFSFNHNIQENSTLTTKAWELKKTTNQIKHFIMESNK